MQQVPKNQYLVLSIVFLIALLTRLSLGAETNPEVTTTAPKSGGLPVEIFLGPDMAVKSGRLGTGWGFNVGAVTPVFSGIPVYAGVDFGLNFWSYQYAAGFVSRPGITLPTERTVGVQLLPTAFYRLPVPALGYLHPFFGVSVGPTILVTSGIARRSGTRLVFEALFRPGLGIDLTEKFSLNIEPKLGLLDGDFLFQPVLSASLAL
jgi:hypothetical protein